MSTVPLPPLPPLPQMEPLRHFVQVVWQQSDVVALWLGGSFGREEADRYSDVDLRLAVAKESLTTWRSANFATLFGQPCLDETLSTKVEGALLYHVALRDCTLFDIWIQTPERPLHSEPKIILACRDDELLSRLQQPGREERLQFAEVDGALLEQEIRHFWLNHIKTQKVIYRGLHLTWRDGSYLFSGLYLRLKFIEATGRDCGNVSVPPLTIHSLTPVVQALQAEFGDNLLPIVLPSMRGRADSLRAVERLSSAISEVGRLLAQSYQFDYPNDLEERVLASWARFSAEIAAEEARA